jgi:hypothetical protein
MAKQFDHLFEQICSFENLWLAFKRAAKGKRAQVEVADFEMNADWHLLAIQAALRAGTWQPGRYRSFVISDPKRRVVSAAPFADRVVHHAATYGVGCPIGKSSTGWDVLRKTPIAHII